MAAFSLVHWLVVLVIWAIWIIPLWRILKRIGWAPAWSLIALIPVLGIVLLWVIAFARWDQEGDLREL